MKKIFAALLLFCHINASMFLPQGPEEDQYDANGIQINDVNSVVEFIAVKLGYSQPNTDEDDDSGQNFHLAKAFNYDFEQHYIIVQQASLQDGQTKEFPDFINGRIEFLSFDVATPPPEA